MSAMVMSEEPYSITETQIRSNAVAIRRGGKVTVSSVYIPELNLIKCMVLNFI